MHSQCMLMLDLREVGAVLGSAEQTEEPMEQRPKTKSRFWPKKFKRLDSDQIEGAEFKFLGLESRFERNKQF